MAANTPPLSQHRADTTRFRKSFLDLSNDEKASCDDLLLRITDHNRAPTEATDASRRVLWNKVFQQWDTNAPIIKPVLPKRTAADTSLPVGTLKEDCPPPSQGTKRKADGSYSVPASRQRHATAMIKMNINVEAHESNWKYTDIRGSILPAHLVVLREGYTISQVRSMVMNHWDHHEIIRVSTYNERLLVFWARHRLVARLQFEKRHGFAGRGPQNDAVQERPAAGEEVPDPESTSPMRLVLGADIFKTFQLMVGDTTRISAEHPAKFFEWEDRVL
jgi:hypothetical protein